LPTLQEAFAKASVGTASDTTSQSKGTREQVPVMKSDWAGKPLVLGIPPVDKVRSIPKSVGTFLAAESHYLRANKAIIAGDLPGAIAAYKDALAVDPNYADVLGDYASVLALQQNWQAAAEMFEKAIAARPEDSLVHTNYARVLMQLGKSDQAKKELDEAFRIDPKNRVALVALANVEMKEGRYDKAIGYLEKAITLYPSSANLHDRLAYVLGRSGEIGAAVKHSQEAVNLDPKMLSARLNLGANLALSGDMKGAVGAYEAASQLAPDNADTHYCLSKILESGGQFDRSKSELQKFVELASASDPRLPEARQRLTDKESR